MKPSSFDAEFFTDSHELDEPDMFFFNFWVGPEGDLGMVGAWLGFFFPKVPCLGGSIDFDTGNRFPQVLGVRAPQKPSKIHIKI